MLILEIAAGIILGGIVLAVLAACFAAGGEGIETGLTILLALTVGGAYMIFGKAGIMWIGALMLIGSGLWIVTSTVKALLTWWHRRAAHRLGITLAEYEWRLVMRSMGQPVTPEGWGVEKGFYEKLYPDK